MGAGEPGCRVATGLAEAAAAGAGAGAGTIPSSAHDPCMSAGGGNSIGRETVRGECDAAVGGEWMTTKVEVRSVVVCELARVEVLDEPEEAALITSRSDSTTAADCTAGTDIAEAPTTARAF